MKKDSRGSKGVLGDNPFGALPSPDAVPARPSRPPLPSRPHARKSHPPSIPSRPPSAPQRRRSLPSVPPPPPIEVEQEDLQDKISAVQEQIQSLLHDVTLALERGEITDPGQRQQYREALVDFAGQMQGQITAIRTIEGAEPGVRETLRRLVSPSAYLQKINRFFVAGRGVEVDRFGMDPVLEENLRPAIEFMYSKYWRVHTEGLENVPLTGGCLVVANHAPVAGFDGLMLRWAITRKPPGRPCRWLMEDELLYTPYIGMFCQRLGAVRASRENAGRLLSRGVAVATFPEGNRAIRRLYKDRYKLERFGRGGFVRLAISKRVPVVPVAMVGPEESATLLARVNVASAPMSLPFIPITPTFPLLGPLGILPLPREWRIKFGRPILFDDDPAAADDQARVSRLGNDVRARIQAMLDEMLESQGHRGRWW